MPFPWQIATSSVVGALITLVGVFVGAALTSRAQRRHWDRDKQIDACSAVLAESTSVQIAIRQNWKLHEPIEWVAWNQALAALWLVGEPEVVEAAARIDATFWRQKMRIRYGEIVDERTWAEARDLMEADRLNFINAARVGVRKSRTRMAKAPIGRTPLPELPEPPR